MGKVKEQLLNENTSDFELGSSEYCDYIEKEKNGWYENLERESKLFNDISDEQYYSTDFLLALDYAFDQIKLSPDEIGMSVYIDLLKEQVLVYLQSIVVTVIVD